ncbi:hypothetical protein [Tritonibacter mobilis]|uniref:hypothetical protein n=1 Tax=Tritonibacter mobilis TaxID=379347 RepID=UPI000806D835|nr:hypothetical protein [Tritonibacter mobilis]
MVELIAFSVGVLMLVSSAQAGDKQSGFDGEAYLCDSSQIHLESYIDVIVFNEFMKDVRSKIVAPDVSNCASGRWRALNLISEASEPEVGSMRTAFVFSWVRRSREMQSFEARYANDAEMLLQLALACETAASGRGVCMRETLETVPDAFFADSPVFCSLVEETERVPEAFGPAPAVAIRRELPFLCSTLLGAEGQNQDAWWQSVDRSLFPATLQE